MRRQILLTGILGIALAYFCTENSKRAEAEAIITEWIGKEIRFPENFQCNVLGKDTTSILCSGLMESEYKLLLCLTIRYLLI
jgi:transposase